MKKGVIFITLIVYSMISYSQYGIINWTIFIDGKLPETTALNGKFICFENTPKEKIIEFKYTIGDIKILEDDFNYIKENSDLIGMMTMKIYYQEFTKKSRNLYVYSFDVSSYLLRLEYVVLRITNINKKKGIFYFGYSGDGESSLWYSKEPRIFCDFDWKIVKRGVTSDTIMMKRMVFIPTDIPKNKKETRIKGEMKTIP